MTTHQKGWAFVLAQGVFLVVLILLPGGNDWPSFTALDLLGSVLFWGGLVLVGIASLGLGRALTPTPVPTAAGELTTSGLYGLVRHPIYTGVLSIVVGIVLRSRSIVVLVVGVVTIAFFYVKSSWEENQLRSHYDGYEAYARRTPRFIPWTKRS